MYVLFFMLKTKQKSVFFIVTNVPLLILTLKFIQLNTLNTLHNFSFYVLCYISLGQNNTFFNSKPNKNNEIDPISNNTMIICIKFTKLLILLKHNDLYINLSTLCTILKIKTKQNMANKA